MTDRKILALGFFDGIHIGHTMLLRSAAELAREIDCGCAVITFDIHPDTLVRGADVALLNTDEERNALVRRLSGIEEIVRLPFTQELMHMAWGNFLDLLVHDYGAAGFVVGSNFRFGWRGTGDSDKLIRWCAFHSLPCRVIPSVALDGVTASSTLIRMLLTDRRIEDAARFLGHAPLRIGEAKAGVIPHASHSLRLPCGSYLAALTLPDGTVQPDETVHVTEEALFLSHPVSGTVTVEFTAALEED